MKIAVTGATGFLGRYIVQRLAVAGHALRCWFRPSSDRSGLESLQSQIEWIPGKLGEPADATTLISGCDAVVHAALWRPGAAFQGAEGNVVKFAEINVLGTLRLIDEAFRQQTKRFVFISSCAVHDRILDDRALDEKHPLWPASHYGAHKAAVEKFVHSYGQGHDFPICALRPTGIYGMAHPVEQSKWFDLIREIVEGNPVTCRGGGKEVHAADVAKAVELLLQADAINGETFNCCDRYISQYDVASIAKRLSGSSSMIDGQPMRPKNYIETYKIQCVGMQFGHTPLLETTIQEIVEFVRQRL